MSKGFYTEFSMPKFAHDSYGNPSVNTKADFKLLDNDSAYYCPDTQTICFKDGAENGVGGENDVTREDLAACLNKMKEVYPTSWYERISTIEFGANRVIRPGCGDPMDNLRQKTDLKFGRNTVIMESGFARSEHVGKVDFHGAVIGQGAFNCSDISLLKIHSNPASIQPNAFRDCEKLTDVDIVDSHSHESNEECYVDIGENAFKGSGVIDFNSEGGILVGKGAFSDCKHLRRVTFEPVHKDDALEIGAKAFEGTKIKEDFINEIPKSGFGEMRINAEAFDRMLSGVYETKKKDGKKAFAKLNFNKAVEPAVPKADRVDGSLVNKRFIEASQIQVENRQNDGNGLNEPNNP